MLSSHVGVIERLGLGQGQLQHFLRTRREGHVADRLGLRPLAHGLLDLVPYAFQRYAHAFEHIDGHAFPQNNQPQQEMLRPHIGVIKTIRLAARQLDYLLRPRREICKSIHSQSTNSHEAILFFTSCARISSRSSGLITRS